MDKYQLIQLIKNSQFDSMHLSRSDLAQSHIQIEHSKLYYAIRDGNIPLTAMLLVTGATLLDSEQYTPFMLACYYGHMEIVEILYENKWLDDRDVYGNTPLIYAAWSDHIDVAKWLLKQGANINAVNVHGDSALFMALRTKHPEMAQVLIENKNYRRENPNVLSYDAFVVAVVNGYLDIADALYYNHMNLDLQYTENNSLLHMCAMNGNLESAQWLLKHGANSHTKNAYGVTPLVMAALKGHAGLVSLFLTHSIHDYSLCRDMDLALFAAAHQGHVGVVDFILYHHANVTNTTIYNALMAAATNGHWPVMVHLLDLAPEKIEAKINKRYYFGENEYGHGNTLLQSAVEHGHLDVVQNLVRLGADLHVKNKNGENLLHIAARTGHLPLLRWLSMQGLHVNHVNKQGDTALHLAVRSHDLDMARCLLLHGGNWSIENKQKETAEFLAQSQPELIECIQEIKAKDFNHMHLTKSHVAATSSEDKVILQSLPLHHDFEAKNTDGITPIQLAADLGNVRPLVIMLLWQAKGNRDVAQWMAHEMQTQSHPKSKAFACFKQAIKEIASFPEHRRQPLLRLLSEVESKEKPADEISDLELVESVAPSDTVELRLLGFFSKSRNDSCNSMFVNSRHSMDSSSSTCEQVEFLSCSH